MDFAGCFFLAELKLSLTSRKSTEQHLDVDRHFNTSMPGAVPNETIHLAGAPAVRQRRPQRGIFLHQQRKNGPDSDSCEAIFTGLPFAIFWQFAPIFRWLCGKMDIDFRSITE